MQLGQTRRSERLITKSLLWAAHTRYAIPAVLGLALVAMAVNEATYQHTWRTLTRGITLTDARIEAAKTLQALTLMEAAARAALARPNLGDQQRFDAASQAFVASRINTIRLIAQVDKEGLVAVDKLRQLSDEQAARYRSWMDQARAAPPTALVGAAAAGSATSRDGTAELQVEFDDVLSRAAAVQQAARVSLYDAMMLNRMAVHLLVVLSVVVLVLFARELRRSNAARGLEHERLATQIKVRTAHLRALADHLVTAREDERARLARDLHDEMGGLLTAMKLELARLRRVQGVPQPALDRLASIDARLNDGIALKRRVVENLRPSSLDQLGLKVALELLCADAAQVMAVPVHVHVQEMALGSGADLTLFRTVQESLTNIAKYAAPRNVWVDLARTGSTVTLTVRDDGRGFDPSQVSAGRHGLLGMQVRAEGHQGSLQIISQPGQGTQIVVTLPAQICTQEAQPA
jgi:signal transduction histidine kinase